MNKVETYERFVRPIVDKFSPNTAHEIAIKSLELTQGKRFVSRVIERLMTEAGDKTSERLQTVWGGVVYQNLIFLAAGFDKDARVIRGLSNLGFGGIEIGSVLERPQSGFPKPNVWRVEEEGILNRMGFPSVGVEEVKLNLAKTGRLPIPIGINVGVNQEVLGTDHISSYCKVIEQLSGYASYFVLNLSSPNTFGLRDLQRKEQLNEILFGVKEMMFRKGIFKPVYLKVSPEEHDQGLYEMVEVCFTHGINGFVATNTSISHDYVVGGLSGKPLEKRSTRVIAKLREFSEGRLEIAASGGIDDLESVLRKISAGGKVLQIYSGLVYKGPALPSLLAISLDQWMINHGVSSIEEVVGETLI